MKLNLVDVQRLDLKNWIKKKDADGNTVTDSEGEPVLEEVYSVKTGTVLTINTKNKKLKLQFSDGHGAASSSKSTNYSSRSISTSHSGIS